MKTNNSYSSSFRILLIDLLCVIISFILASFIRFGGISNLKYQENYSILFVILILVNIGISFLKDTYTGFFRRGFTSELKVVIKLNIIGALWVGTIMYLTKMGTVQSRLFIILFFIYNILLTYLVRQYYKIIMLAYYKKSDMSNKIMVITTNRNVYEIIENIKKENLPNQLITSIAIIDQDLVGKEIGGIPIKANRNNLMDIIRYEVIDEVFISILPDTDIEIDELITELELMGIKIQLNIDIFGLRIKEKKIETFSKYHVLIFTRRDFLGTQLFAKRVLDILGAVVGLLCTAVLTIIIAPAIYIESPGPIFFSQIRIGKNGRRFRIYKFRSMYLDAEKRKSELLALNEMQGFMFKISEDPRVTKVGKFIRKTSLDEFPQFFNVLIGDMSLVGTRPPTEDEFLHYKSNHRRRVSLKPGLTGLWQVSGRSDITDFEKVVQLDLDYIDRWSFGFDIKLISKTILILFFGRGAR